MCCNNEFSHFRMSDRQEKEIKMQEFPLLKVPAETLNRKLRRGQKFIEKGASGINLYCKDSQWSGLSDKEARGRLKTLKSKLSVLRNQMENIHKAEKSECNLINARLDHLKNGSKNEYAWQYTRFHRQMADFLYQRGFDKTGDMLAKSIDIEELTNAGLFRKIMELEQSLAEKQTSKCLAWCLQNRSKLQKIKSKFEVLIHKKCFDSYSIL